MRKKPASESSEAPATGPGGHGIAWHRVTTWTMVWNLRPMEFIHHIHPQYPHHLGSNVCRVPNNFCWGPQAFGFYHGHDLIDLDNLINLAQVPRYVTYWMRWTRRDHQNHEGHLDQQIKPIPNVNNPSIPDEIARNMRGMQMTYEMHELPR